MQLLLTKIRPRPDAQLLQTVLLRSMQQAIYSPHNGGHFGLAYEAYAHFTSPIRRYPDLLVHRAIKALSGQEALPARCSSKHARIAAGTQRAARNAHARPERPTREADADSARWEKLGLICSANERRADEASRDVEAWLKSYYMREKVGENYSGTDQRGRAVRHLRRARRPLCRGAGACLRTRLGVLPVQRAAA